MKKIGVTDINDDVNERDRIENKIKTAFAHSVPDVLDSILSSCEEQKGEEIMNAEFIQKNIIKQNTTSKSWVKSFSTIAAVFLLFVVGIAGGGIYGAKNVDSIVSLDVNPSLEIKVNKNEKVLEVNPFNKEAEIVVGDMDFKNADLEMAVNALIGSMLKNGYIDNMANSILISVENKDEAKGARLQEKLGKEISTLLKDKSIEGAVLSQTVPHDEDEQLRELSKKYDMSIGKAQWILQLIEANPSYRFEDLAKLSINEINLLMESKNIDLNNVSSLGKASDKSYIGYDNAKSIAYKHANLSSQDVKELEIELDYDDGKLIYEIEFYANGTEYEYDIDAVSGSIIKYDQDKDNDYYEEKYDDKFDDKDDAYKDKNDDYDDKYDDNKGKSEKVTQKSYIGYDDAKRIATEHAGVSSSSLKDYEVDLDHDDEKVIYEIEFYANGVEYEYYIDAISGKIISFEQDRDDDFDDYKYYDDNDDNNDDDDDDNDDNDN